MDGKNIIPSRKTSSGRVPYALNEKGGNYHGEGIQIPS